MVIFPRAFSGSIRIDVGSTTPYNDTVTGYQWLADVAYSLNGSVGRVPSTNYGPVGLSVVDQTLRFWKTGSSCYNVPVAAGEGRYLIRVSFCYNNYDSLFLASSAVNGLPVVGVNVEEQFVEAVSNFGGNASAFYSDYIATVTDGIATVCVYPLPGPGGGAVGLQPPFLNSLQILPVVSAPCCWAQMQRCGDAETEREVVGRRTRKYLGRRLRPVWF